MKTISLEILVLLKIMFIGIPTITFIIYKIFTDSHKSRNDYDDWLLIQKQNTKYKNYKKRNRKDSDTKYGRINTRRKKKTKNKKM